MVDGLPPALIFGFLEFTSRVRRDESRNRPRHSHIVSDCRVRVQELQYPLILPISRRFHGPGFLSHFRFGGVLTFSSVFQLGASRNRSRHPRGVFEYQGESTGTTVWTDSGNV